MKRRRIAEISPPAAAMFALFEEPMAMGAPKRLDCVLAASMKSARIAAHGGMLALPIDRSEKR
jgi:hypothetical protein